MVNMLSKTLKLIRNHCDHDGFITIPVSIQLISVPINVPIEPFENVGLLAWEKVRRQWNTSVARTSVDLNRSKYV